MIRRLVALDAIGFFVVPIFFCLCGSAHAKELVIAFSHDIPPFVTDNGKGGLEIEIVAEALKHKGHTFTAIQRSYKELGVAVAQTGIDAAAGVRETDDKTFYSDYFIVFKNFAITKKKSGITIEKIQDLKGKSIVTWENAHRDLGKEFESLFSPAAGESRAGRYLEHPVQERQVEMFWRDEAEAIIIDELIFKWFTKKLREKAAATGEVVYHDIFPGKTEFQLNFRDREMRDDFNEGLRHIREKGIYRKIVGKYEK